MRRSVYIIGLIAACGLGSCESYQKNSTHQQVSDESIASGKKLAAVYCQSCHVLPDPSMLNAKSWEKGVLPRMGPMLGVFNYGFQQYPSYRNDLNIGPGFYPAQPLLNPEQWQQVLDYFTSTAPDTIEAGKNDLKITVGLDLFRSVTPQFSAPSATVSYIKFDTVMAPGTLMLYEVNKKSLFRFDAQLRMTDSLQAGTSIVDLSPVGKTAVACDMVVMVPNNGRFGKANRLWLNDDGKMAFDQVPVFDSLRRPVQITVCDLNKDGIPDYLVCEYGNLKGALSWFEGTGNRQYSRHVIREVPGAIKTWLRDYNHDGLTDIYAQFAQGDESIFLYTNTGNGKFREERLLRFPPCYGSAYFELADINKDGFDDIIYACGDNADYSPILKPYHGLYIFLNDGKNAYTQKYFFHMNGCFKAMVRDFDHDGDDDIAAISFFPDHINRPEEGFVYLENDGNLNFRPFSIPETQNGKWLTMDAGDLDGDGKIDIVLGNFTPPMRTGKTGKNEDGPPFLFLKNVGK